MNIYASTFTALILGTMSLSADDLRETQFPAKLPKEIIVGGANYATSECLKPWVASRPGEFAGKYVSQTITDGMAYLDIKTHEDKSSSGEVRWHVDGTLETAVGIGVNHVLSFKNSELREPKQPCFEVIDRLTSALFVVFTNPEDEEKKPKEAVVIGDQVFVRQN
jgi:hypothetical protein